MASPNACIERFRSLYVLMHQVYFPFRDLLASVTNPVIPMPHMSSSASVSSDGGRKRGGSALLDLVSNPAGGSFHMAYNNVDMVGDVDVIAHSDVVKKLIRLPFGKFELENLLDIQQYNQ